MTAPDFDAYLRELCETPLSEHTEHTGRTALENFLKTVAAAYGDGRVSVQQEPKREKDKGAPDFKISRQGMILGYVETKPVGEDLDRVLKSDQLKKYRSLSDNILLTDYLHFVWIDKDSVHRETLCHATDLDSPKFKVREDRAVETARLLRGFFSTAPEGIGRSQQLALALAVRSRLLRDYLAEELIRQHEKHTEGRLYGLFQMFRGQVFHELTLKEFADAFAQMLAYGLFLAKINSDSEKVSLQNARQFVPGSFRLIRELVHFLADLEEPEYRDVRWVVEEILSIVNSLDMAAIHEDLSFRQRRAISRKVRAEDEEEHRLFERDPFIYFYEDYLKEYDAKTRKSRGVYYTPPPVVNFIVRAIDDILKDSFGIEDGLADHKRVTVLDFACGTGTFLLEVFERIFEQIGGPDAGRADLIVQEHLLKNIFGFEYLIAPYTIAHLKLSQYLSDKGHMLEDDDRLKIFLTNTLEPIEPQKNLLLPAVTAEVEAAQQIKEKPILVITGNPPYSGHSKNKGKWIKEAVKTYREGFPELSKPGQGKWLQDDYVKFIRFAQMKMEGVDEGVVGVITNHSWIDNPTFKGMRKSLTESFDQIYVLDLHGNSKKKERTPQGGDDENVFDIVQGVAISLFVKGKKLESAISHADVWGKRLPKYRSVNFSSIRSLPWKKLQVEEPDWFLKPYNNELGKQYRKFWSLPDIFSPMGDPAPGMVSTHDDFAVSFTAQDARWKVKKFLSTKSEKDARNHFKLCTQDQWNYDTAMEELPQVDLDSALTFFTYRPFDTRWTVWNKNVAVHRRERVMRHLLEDNFAITVSRQAAVLGSLKFDAAMAVERPVDFNFFYRGGEYVFPAYLISEKSGNIGPNAQKRENLSSDFRIFLNARYDHHYSPEEIMGYIYAVLHATKYRESYDEFLRIEFPRIPFPETADDFGHLSRLGWALVQAHLLRDPSRRGQADYHGRGDHQVESVRYSAAEEAIHINKSQCFKPVPQAVWEFHIGGYQVLDKYLKSRKGRTLSLDEIRHVAKVADSLDFTIDQMAAIDVAYRSAFESGG